MIKTQKCSKLWKIAEIRPLKKVQNPGTYNDYRPVSPLWHIKKVAETAFHTIYKQHVIPKLNTNQYAYLTSSDTTDAFMKMVDDWTRMLDQKKNNTICSISPLQKRWNPWEYTTEYLK